MGLFKFNWLHRIIRRNTKPIPGEKALLWKTRLSIVYMLVGWNALGFLIYMTYTGRGDWPTYYGLKTDEEMNKRPGVYFAEILGMKKATILSYRGFTKTGEVHYENLEKKDIYDSYDIRKSKPKVIDDSQTLKQEGV